MFFNETEVSISKNIYQAPQWYQRHAMNVAMLAYKFANHSKIVPSTDAYEAGFFHDIGKIVLPANLWNKPFPCGKHELKKIRMHPILGRAIGKRLGLPNKILDCIEMHHERVDGGGYPHGITDIPLLVQVISVVDTYVAMGEPRSYHIPKRGEQALAEMESVRGKQLDASITDLFIRFLRSVRPPADHGLFPQSSSVHEIVLPDAYSHAHRDDQEIVHE